MKKIFLSSFVIFSLLTGVRAFGATTVKSIEVDYSQILLPVDRGGHAIPQAIVGGYVDYEGTDQVFITMMIAGQSYTQPLDRKGMFSFLVYASNAGSYQLEAWSHEPTGAGGGKSLLTVNKELPGTPLKK